MTSDSLMPVRLQIALAKEWKRAQAQSAPGFRQPKSPPVATTTFRKEKLASEAYREAKAAAAAAAEAAAAFASKNLALASLYGSAAPGRAQALP